MLRTEQQARTLLVTSSGLTDTKTTHFEVKVGVLNYGSGAGGGRRGAGGWWHAAYSAMSDVTLLENDHCVHVI